MELIDVMEPILSDKIMVGDEWTHQVKWDGIRGISYLNGSELKLYTKNGRERSAFYPELHNIVNLFQGQQAVLDGEVVVFDPSGRPSFDLILHRERMSKIANLTAYMKKFPAHYILFDILFLNGKDLRCCPLEQRKEILAAHVDKSPVITITDDFSDGNQLLALMKQKQFEGIVSKLKHSRYIAGKKHNLWFKTKIYKKLLTVIGGVSWKAGYPNSLLLGKYDEEKLIYIGNASSGLTRDDLQLLKEFSVSLEASHSPFVNLTAAKDTTWFKPVLTCWVGFLEWTDQHSLRHPKIIGFSKQSAKEADGKEYYIE